MDFSKIWASKLLKMRKLLYRYEITLRKSKVQKYQYCAKQNELYEIIILNPFGKLDTIYKNVRLIDIYRAFKQTLRDDFIDKKLFKKKISKIPKVVIEAYEPFGGD